MEKDFIYIETERLILRKFKLTDIDDLVEGLNNLQENWGWIYNRFAKRRVDRL